VKQGINKKKHFPSFGGGGGGSPGLGKKGGATVDLFKGNDWIWEWPQEKKGPFSF